MDSRISFINIGSSHDNNFPKVPADLFEVVLIGLIFCI